MFVTLFAWAQSPTSGYVEASEAMPIAGLMTVGIAIVFVGWLLFMGIREVLRVRREDRRAEIIDLDTVSLESLGPTMADGGEPLALNARKGRAKVG